MVQDILPTGDRPSNPGDVVRDIPTTSGDHLRLRLYRDSDSEEVRQLFLSCIVGGRHSPLARGVKYQALRSMCYSGLLLSVYLCLYPRKQFELFGGSTYLPLVIWVSISLGIMALHAYGVKNVYHTHCNTGLRQELSNLGCYYYNENARALGCKMWVIEDVRKERIIGCCGLDNSTPVPFMRRMSVSPEYRGQGLGKLFLETFLDHIDWYNKEVILENVKGGKLIEVVDLTTTTYQPNAVHLYTKYGWALQSKSKLSNWMFGFHLYTFRKIFSTS